jgi:hypothetical protein
MILLAAYFWPNEQAENKASHSCVCVCVCRLLASIPIPFLFLPPT